MSQFAPRINCRQEGTGNPILLIHGFPMSGEIWEDQFVHTLSKEFSVFIIDLPGFGSTPLPQEQFTLGSIAGHLIDWLNLKKLTNVIIIGHSLGGYVALAMVARNPEKFAGFGLLHSTAFADSAEKKQSRDKTIEFIEKNGAPAFTTNFIPQLFADKTHPGIEKVKKIGGRTTAATVIGYTQAMRDRPDRTNVIKSFLGPVLLVAGDKDPGIPVNTIHEQAALGKQTYVHVLDNQAHMSMLEIPQTSSEVIRDFARIIHKGG